MNWFNYLGLIIVVGLLVPNVIYYFRHQIEEKKNVHPAFVILENVGRYGAMIFMVFNIPYTWFSFFCNEGLLFYVIVNFELLYLYIILFIVFRKKTGLVKTLFLSIIPSIIFIFSGIMIVSIPLMVFGSIFAFAHIYISVKNA